MLRNIEWGGQNRTMGGFNNHVTFKFPFLTQLSLTFTLSHVCSREPFCVTSRLAQTPPLESETKALKSIKHATANYTFHICNLNYTKIHH